MKRSRTVCALRISTENLCMPPNASTANWQRHAYASEMWKKRGQCPGTSIELYNVFSFSPAAWCCRVRRIFYFLIGQKPRYLRAIFYWAIIFSFFLIKLCAVNMGVMSRQCQPCARRSTTKLINHREAPMKTRLARDLSDDDQLSSQFMRAR